MVVQDENTREVIAGRYRLERLLGEGGMAAVHVATDLSSGQHVALKRLTHESATKERLTRLFEREFRALSGLRHPGIIQVFDYGIERGRPFYTMELLEGDELSCLAPMPWQQACLCLRDVASILGLLHARGWVHRDISPRNLFRLTDGRIKLLDFGALASVGEATEVVGTPPFVPPEAYHQEVLDARSDLYSLGALGYWLVTGVNAYPAKAFAELPRLWKQEPPRLNVALKLLKQEDDTLPEQLDALIQSLLRIDKRERPLDTGSVVDRLTALAGLTPEARDEAVRGYLESQVFVGRERERERFLQRLEQAQHHQAVSLFIEGSEGVGRSRLLDELTLTARMAGAVVLRADGTNDTRPYGLACVLAHALLTALPEQARELALPHADVLALLTPELRRSLGRSTSTEAATNLREQRLRRQEALRAWFLEVAKRHLVVMLVDDLGASDEESQALLAALALSSKGAKLLLVVSARSSTERALSAPAQSLRAEATRLWLLPLEAHETRAMLGSVFGEVRYLERVAERLHQHSEGNPRYCLELARHLVQTGAARYAEGSWNLPSEIDARALPRSLAASVVGRLERISPEARRLARRLSIPDYGSLGRELCLSVAEGSPDALDSVLRELVQHDLLREAQGVYHFAHPVLREALLAELPSEEREKAHRAFATQLGLVGDNDFVPLVRATLHWLHAGDIRRGEAWMLKASNIILEGAVDSVGSVAHMFEQVLLLLDEKKRDKYSLIIPLSILCLAGYFSDRRYGARHGERAIALLQGVLRIRLAEKLRRFLGARLGLIVALAIAGIGLRRARNRAPTLAVTVRCLLSAASCLAGISAIAIDPKATRRYASIIQPLTALGKEHAATFLHHFCVSLALGVEDRPAESARTQRKIVEWLESDRPIHNMNQATRLSYLAGARFSLGVRECWKDGTEGLEAAAKLERFGPLYAMYADQLRAITYSSQGDLERASEYRRRVELHAIQLGCAWQVETWAPADATKTALWTHDAITMKRAAQDLGRLAGELPSFEVHERRARGAYLVLRGKHQEALALLSNEENSRAVIGWARSRSLLARATRELGDPTRAYALCLEARNALESDDLAYVAHSLSLEVELALCEAALGRYIQAKSRLDDRISIHEPREGRLILSVLYQARARILLWEGDLVQARADLEKLERWARPTGIPSLLEAVTALKQELIRAEDPEGAQNEDLSLIRDPARLVTHVEALMTRTARHVGERAAKAVQIALELTGADSGFVVVLREAQPLAHFGGPAPDDSLVQWARERLVAALRNDETALVEEGSSMVDLQLKSVGNLRYCVTPLWVRRLRADVPVAAIALGFSHGNPMLPSVEVLRVIGEHLDEPESAAQLRTG